MVKARPGRREGNAYRGGSWGGGRNNAFGGEVLRLQLHLLLGTRRGPELVLLGGRGLRGRPTARSLEPSDVLSHSRQHKRLKHFIQPSLL